MPNSNPFSKAITAVVLNSPFFASVAMRRKMVEDPNVDTAGISRNGTIYYCREWVESLTERQRIFLLCHECLHYLGRDVARGGARLKYRWNVACDAVINGLLEEAGIGDMPLPGIDPVTGKTKEQVYAELPEQPSDYIGDLLDLDEDTPEATVQLELAQAVQAQQRAGNVPAGLQRLVDEVLRPPVSWKDRLARWLTDASRDDYSWRRPSRRFRDVYMPSLNGAGAAQCVFFGFDTSGSTADVLSAMVADVKEILEQVTVGERIIVAVDTEVYPADDDFELRGGGGTDLRRLVDYTNEHDIHPTLAIWLTDGHTPWPESVPYPLVVLTTNQPAPETLAPTIRIES